MGGQLGSEQKPYRTGVTFQGVTPPVPSQGSPGSTAINDVDLSSFLQAGVGGEQTQPQVTNQGPTPLDDFIAGVETIVQQDTNFNQDGLADEYNKDIGMPNYLSRAAEMYSKDNEELSKAFGLYGGVTGGITDADVSVKLENLPPEAYNQLQRNYADLLRQSAGQRRASQPYDYNQFNPLSESFDPTSAIANLTPVTSSIGRGMDNAAQGLAGLGAGVVGLGAKALGALIPGQDMVDEFADKAFDVSQQFYHESGKKYVDINQSIAEDSPLNIWNPNNFSTTLYNALSMGTELGVTALIPFLKVGGVAEAAITKFGAKQALNAISNHIAKTLKVANVGIAKGFRDSLARATLQEIKTGGLNIPGVGQLSPSMVMASLQAGARGLATAMTLSPGALFGTYQKSNGDIPNVFNAFNEGGNEELRKTDFLSVANRFWQDIAAEAALAPVLGVGVGAVKSLGTNIVANGVNLKEIKKALPALPPSETAKVIELAAQLRHQAVAQEVFKVAEIHNIQVELPQANIGKAFAKWTMDEVKPKSTGTFNVKGQPGTHPDVTKVLEDYSKVQNKLVEDLKNVKTKAEAAKLIQQAEIEFAQVADFAKAVTSKSNGELKRIAKTRVPAKDISEGIENLVKTNNGGFIPVSLEKTNVAATVNSLIDTDTPSTLLPKLNKEIKLLMEKVKQPVPTDSKLLPGYTKELENNKSLLKQKNLELRQQKNLQEAKSRSNLLTQIMDKQKEIQEIVEGTRLQVQEGTVKKNLAKAEKIINAHNAEVLNTPAPQAKAIQNGVSAAEYPTKLQEFENAKKQFSIEHPKVPQELLDVNQTIERRTGKNRDKLYLTQEENDTIIQLEKEIADLETKLPPTMRTTMRTEGKPSEPVVLSKEQVERHLNNTNWGIENTKEIIAKLKQATSKDKEILVPDTEAISKAVSEFKKTDQQYLEAAKKASELYGESGQYFKTVLGLPYADFSPNIWSLKNENINTKKLAQILNTTETVVKEGQLVVKEAWENNTVNLGQYHKFSNLLSEWVDKQDVSKRFWTATAYRDQLSNAYRDSLQLPPKKVKFDARLDQLAKAEKELEQQLLKKEELENYKPNKAKTEKPSLLDGSEDFEPEVVDYTPYGGKEAVDKVKAEIQTKQDSKAALLSRSENPNELNASTNKREELITQYGTDKNISAPLGLDYNQPTIGFSIPSKDSVLNTIGTLKTKNQTNKRNGLQSGLISRGDTSQPTPDVSVEVNNFNDLIAYLGKSLSRDGNTVPTSLSDDVYNNAVKQALIGDGIIGTMAKRTGKTKADIYKTIRFEITPDQGAGTLIGGAFYGRVLPAINVLQMNSKNPSTVFLHELIHTFDTVGYFTKQEREVLGKWHGKPQDSTAAKEALSYGFQEYLDTGKGPTSKITKIFDQLKESLTEVLAPLLRHAQLFLEFGKEQPLKVTDEVADLFGKLIDDGSFKEAYSEFIKKKPQLIPDTPTPVKQVRKPLAKKLEEAGIPLKPAKKGMNTKNRLYQLTKEDIELFDTNHPDLSTLSIKDKRLLASEELNDLDPLQLKELNNELNRIYDDSDEGGLLGRKLARLVPDDSIFRPEYTTPEGVTTLIPEDMLSSLNKLESDYNRLADIDLQLANTVKVNPDLEVQRTVLAKQLVDNITKKMGGFELNQKKLVENYNNSLKEAVPDEYKYLVPTPESQKALLSNGAKQRIVTKIMTTDYYKALSQSDKSLLQRTLRGKDGSPELAKQVLKDILNGKTPSILDEVKIEVTPNGKTATKNETDVKTTSKEDIPQTISEIKEDNTVQQDTPTELGDSVGSNDYYTPEQVAKTVNNLRGNAGIIPSRATIDATIADIFKQSNKAGLDYESTIGIMSQFFEDVNIEMNLQTNFGTYNIPSAFSRGTIGRTAESLGINPNSLIHYINQDVVGDGLQKVYKAEAVAAMANHFDNMLKEALTAANKAQDAEYLQRPYNNFPISGNGGTKAKPGLSPTDNLLDVISKIELFTKVVTPDLQKMVEASGLYTSDLNELVKPLQEAKKANALLHDHLPDVAMIEGKKVEMDNPSPITPNDKDSVLEDMYPKSEELVHTKVLQTMIDGKKLAYQQNTFAEVKYKLGELNHLRIQYSNPLRLQLGLGVGKAITSSIAAGLNTAVDTTTSILIGNMVHSTAVMALQFVGGPMGTLYNMQKFSGGLVNTSLASWYYKKTGSNIAKQAGYTQAGVMLEAMAELQAGLGAFKTIGGLWDNIVSTVDTFVQAGKYIPKGGHPMTARHAGSLEPMFRAASKQFDEGSVGRKSVDTLGRWLGAGQKAYATPISYLDSLMTIHTAKVKSRAAVIRDVLLSTEYKDMDFVPGSKESAKYIENKVDEVMPRNYFVWNEATSGAAHAVTFTEPLPKDVGVKNIVQISKEEGIIRSVFGLIDNYAGTIATLVPPLKPYVTLFATVGGNVLNNSVGILGSRDGATFIPAVMGDGTFKVTPYFENLFSTMADDKTYEAMAFSGGSVGLGILSLLGGWVIAEANKDFFTKKGNFLLNEEDDFPGVELLQTSLGHGYNAITGGYDTDTKVRVGGKLTVNLSQIPAAYFVLPAINLYRELTLIEENHSQQLNENYDTSGNVQAQLDVTAQNAKNIAMMNYVQSVFPIDAAKSFADTGKDAFKAIQETFMLTRDLNKVLSNNGGSELLYNPVTLIGTRAMDPLTQELLYNTLAHKLAPQIKELPTINVKVDTHSGLSVYEAASLLKTGTAMETTIKFPGVYDILGNPRVTTRSSIVKQQPGNTTDTGIQELDRLAKRYPQTNLANNLVFNLHPAGGGSFKPSHTVWGGIQGINGSHIVGATLRNYRLENHSDPDSVLYPYNGKTLSQAMRTLINSDAYKNAPDVFLDGDKPLNNPDEVAGRDSKVTMVKTLVNVYHERINEQLIEDPYFSVIESSTSKGVSLKSIVDVENDPGVDNRPQGMGTGRPAPPELLKQFTDELNQNIKNRL